MRKINLIILVLFGILMLMGLIGLHTNGPDSWVLDDWKLFHIIPIIRCTAYSITGAIGFSSELLYFNLVKHSKES